MTRKKTLLIVITTAILGIALVVALETHLIAAISFTIQVVTHDQTNPSSQCQESRNAQYIDDIRCILTGGKFETDYLTWCNYNASNCVYPYKDAGKICHSSSECEGACLGVIGSPSGICSAWFKDTNNCIGGDQTIDGLKRSGICFN